MSFVTILYIMYPPNEEWAQQGRCKGGHVPFGYRMVLNAYEALYIRVCMCVYTYLYYTPL